MAVAALALGMGATPLCAIILVYTNAADFTAALGGSLTRTNQFETLHEGDLVHPVNWVQDGLACSLVSDPLLRLSGLPGALSVSRPAVKIVVRFTSGNVRAAGGPAYLRDADGQVIGGDIEVRVPGGPTFAIPTDGSAPAFFGLVSRGPVLTNFTVTGLATNSFITLDHLVLSEGQPRLEVTWAGGGSLTLRWPAPATGYVLETLALAGGATWLPVSEAPMREGDCWRLTLPASGSGSFFRLRRL